MKRLSEHLADLSVQAKVAEDRVSKAQSEARERLEQQRQEVRYETEQALGKVKQQFEQAKGDARSRFSALQAKVNGDFEQMRQHAIETKGKFDAWKAENYASDTRDDALAAIDYAIAATKLAELRTLDAIAARAAADARASQVKAPEPTVV